ncbi:relaxase/mobilization nuclease domain-containing protein [Yoonia sediminilitoris]|nr:relaxase/mobilization nuclease domain-containing protein [Yoonia sediminilitoris]
MIRFFSTGKGGGAGPVQYLIATEVIAYDENRDVICGRDGLPKMVTRSPRPEVLAGDPERTIHLIDTCRHAWTYTSGVVSFERGDAPTEEQQREVMRLFEELAFAGLQDHQFECLWVSHTHMGRVELHFVVPRQELVTGNSMNIARPGHEPQFDALADMLNHQHAWADPRDPKRQQDAKKSKEAPTRAKSREGLHEQLFELIEEGLVLDRSTLIAALHEMGWETPRLGKKYITAFDPETKERFRLKGAIFDEEWTVEATIEAAFAAEDDGKRRPSARLAGFGVGELHQRYQRACDKRAAYNLTRYGRSGAGDRSADIAPDAELRTVDREGEYSGRTDEAGTDRLDPGRIDDASGSDDGRSSDQRHRRGLDCPDAPSITASADLSFVNAEGGSHHWPWRNWSGVSTPSRQRSRTVSAAVKVRERLREITKGEPIDADTTRKRIARVRGRVDDHLRAVRSRFGALGSRIETLRSTLEEDQRKFLLRLDELRAGVREIATRIVELLGEIRERSRASSALDRGLGAERQHATTPDRGPRSVRQPDQERLTQPTGRTSPRNNFNP